MAVERNGVTMLVGVLLAVAATVPGAGASSAATRAAAVESSTVKRVKDAVLPHGRFDYRRQSWRIDEATGLPRWLALRQGRLSGTVFSSRASNLVAGTDSIAGRLYVWDVAMRRVTLLHPEQWATVSGVSRDGQRVLVRLSAGLFLIDRTAGTTTRVVAHAAGAALTDDGERVVYQDPAGAVPPRLVEWTRQTGATRTLLPDLGIRTFLGMSSDGRFAAFAGGNASELWDATTGTSRDIGRTGLENGNAQRVEVSDNGVLISVRGTGIPAGSGIGGDPVARVHDGLIGGSRGPATHNFGAAVTPDGLHYSVASPQRHLRLVDVATGVRTSPFLARPSGQETWVSVSDDAAMMAYASDGHDVLPGTRRGVANIFLWVRPR